jgi:imidazolonepropionase-like amidohydrolase
MYLIRSKGVFLDPPGQFLPRVVAVDDRTIRFVGAELDLARDFPRHDWREIDLSDRYLSPGLLNTHIHLAFSGEAAPREQYLAEAPGMRVLRALRNAQTLLQSGVTTARDCGSDFFVLEGMREALASGLFDLPTLLLSGPPITQTGGHLHFMGGEVDGADGIRRFVRLLHKRGATSIKVMATGGQMTPGTLPERPAFSQDELNVITETAGDLGLPTVSHCLSGEGTMRSAGAGFHSIEHCAFFERDEHGWLRRAYDPAVTQQILRHRNHVMMGLAAGYHRLDQSRETSACTDHDRFLLEQERTMFGICKQMHEAGVPMVVGTDAGVAATPFDETWLELELMVAAGLSPLEALRGGTVRGARALLLHREAGRVAPGMRADLIAVRDDPLADIRAYRHIDWVMCAGRVVKGPGTRSRWESEERR